MLLFTLALLAPWAIGFAVYDFVTDDDEDDDPARQEETAPETDDLPLGDLLDPPFLGDVEAVDFVVGDFERINFAGATARDGKGGNDTLTGDSGDDALRGGPGDDILIALSGTDQAFGEEGDDIIFGGNGSDRLVGGAGADIIDAGENRDILIGEAGDDWLLGGADQDALDGGAGDDRIEGGDAPDLINGGSGDDTIYAGGPTEDADGLFGPLAFLDRSAGDEIDAGPGDDTIFFGRGDVVTGGDGADLFELSLISSRAGSDTTLATITDFNFDEGDRYDLDFVDRDQTDTRTPYEYVEVDEDRTVELRYGGRRLIAFDNTEDLVLQPLPTQVF